MVPVSPASGCGASAMADRQSAASASALDKLEAAEVVARFYVAAQQYDYDASGWEAFEPLIADEIVYLTQNLKDTTPVSREAFLERFREIHDVHAAEGRGSFYGLYGPIVSISGDTAKVKHHIAHVDWRGPENDDSSRVDGVVDAELARSPGAPWRIALLDVSNTVRIEGHRPPVAPFHP